MKPLISVIMSTLNTNEDFLRESIESILNQSYKNLEFIIIVDGGNDDRIISSYKDERIKIIKHKEPFGLTKSLNEAIKISEGKYIARMDSDDISLVDRFTTQVEFMEKNKNIDITAMFYKEIGKSNKKTCEVFNKPSELKCKLFFTNVIAHPSVMIRKEFLDKNKILYNENYIYSQDFELWTRCSKLCEIAIVPEFGLKYRIHEKQVSSEKSEIQCNLYYKILKRNLNELDLNEKNLNYLLMLNGRKKIENKKELKQFIKLVIEKNKKIKLYEENKFEKLLKIYYIIACIRNKKICFLNINFIEYAIRKLNVNIRMGGK